MQIHLGFDNRGESKDYTLAGLDGGALVSTMWTRQRRHAEDDALASLIIRIKTKQLIKN